MLTPCPHCGEMIAENAVRCKFCGSDETTGWSPDVEYHSVELPDSDPEWTEGSQALADKQRGTHRALLLTVFAMALLIVGTTRDNEMVKRLSTVGLGLIFAAWLVYVLFGTSNPTGGDDDDGDAGDEGPG